MILERAIFIAVYIAEALIAWLYFEFLFSKKTSSLFQLFTFLSGYVCLSIRNCIKRAPKSTVPGQHRFGFEKPRFCSL